MAAAAASTTTSSALAAVLLCAAAFFVAHAKTDGHGVANGDLVAKTCANVTSHNWQPWLNRESCESPLRLDKRSAAAKHPRDLALIAVDLAERAAADADAKVGSVLRSGAGHHSNDDGITALILHKCRLGYAAVASTTPVCRAMVEDYKPGANHGSHLDPSDYFKCARRLRSNARKCWTSIMGRSFIIDDGLSELLWEEVNDAWERADLVEAMLEEMLGVVMDDHYENF